MGEKHNITPNARIKLRQKIPAMDLNRFAGSSDEEEIRGGEMSIGNHNAALEEALVIKNNMSKKRRYVHTWNSDKDSIIFKQDDENDVVDKEELTLERSGSVTTSECHPTINHSGMAEAMSSILGLSSYKEKENYFTEKSVILSKTITPLQRLHKQKNKQKSTFRNKETHKHQSHLSNMQLPFSTTNGNNVTKELELERIHKRVATRGVVALFNAITQHQSKKSQLGVDTFSKDFSSKKGNTQNMTKHSFLEMIKKSAMKTNT